MPVRVDEKLKLMGVEANPSIRYDLENEIGFFHGVFRYLPRELKMPGSFITIDGVRAHSRVA